MNKIQITDKYWITSDVRSWNVSTFLGTFIDDKGKERERWEHYTYHSKFSKAIESLAQRLLKEASREDISGLREEARQIEQILKNASERASEGTNPLFKK